KTTGTPPMPPILNEQTKGVQKPRKITRGWPPKRRREQAARIRKLKPWLRSTGPRSEAGKAKTRLNAQKHGLRSAELALLRGALKRHRLFLRNLKHLSINAAPPGRLRKATPSSSPASGAPTGDPAQNLSSGA